MGPTRYRWWGYVKAVIRDYPAKCRELELMRTQGGGQALRRAPGAKRTTEIIALRGFTGQKGVEYESVRRAVEVTMLKDCGTEAVTLVDLVFWRQSHTLEGAAQKINISYRTARRWHREFIMLTAKYMGLV